MIHDFEKQTPSIGERGEGKNLYRIDLWCGSGFATLPFWVWGDYADDAIDTLFAWCAARGKEYKPWVFDSQKAKTYDLTDDEAEQFFITNTDGTLFALQENFGLEILTTNDQTL